MEDRISQQSKLSAKIGRTVDNISKLGAAKITQGVLESRLTNLEDKWREFQLEHKCMESEASADERKMRYFADDFVATTEEIYLTQKASILDQLRKFTAAPTSTAPAAPAAPANDSASVTRQSLPRLSIPKFSGNYLEWQNFRDLFKAIVIDTRLPLIEQMHHLKTNVTKEAAALLASLPPTGENFATAWQLMCSRYDNTRLLTTAQISSIFALPAMTSESAEELKLLYNGTFNAIGALTSLNRPVNQCDDFLVYMTVQKLDKQSRREWEAAVGSKREPSTFKELQTFLENRICSLEALESLTKSREAPTSSKTSPPSSSRNSKKSPTSSQPGVKSHVSSSTPATQKCALCQQGHYVLFCEAFREKSADDRKAFVIANKLCLNCLGHHYARDCRSQKTCQACKGKHHTMLHDSYASTTPATTSNATRAPADRSSGASTSHNAQVTKTAPTRALLATALVHVSTSFETQLTVRALIDQGSEATFVSESLAQRLKLPRSSASVVVSGIGANVTTTAKGSVPLRFASRINSTFNCQVNALVIPKLTSYRPPSIILTSRWEHLDGLTLADPEFLSARPIELLLGADVYAQLILDGVRKGNLNSPIAQNTQLGWIISGQISSQMESRSSVVNFHISLDSTLSTSLQRFWEQEELTTSSQPQLPEEAECENHFVTTHTRNDEGRYIVRLPLKKPIQSLGDSLTPASQMLQRMERRFSRDKAFYDSYSAFMTEYEALKHMERVSAPISIEKPIYYLPHHGVVRETSSTTKLRVVFNGSQKTEVGLSLNDHLHVGPKLLPELVSILLRWRTHAIVFSADMEKMYRQILVHEDDRDLQRIVWRKHPASPLASYQLRTVTYGLACAPFLAIRVIRQLASDEKSRYPIGAAAISNDVYVDDVLSGADDVSAALLKQGEIIELLKAGGFALRKWTSNSSQLLDHLPPETVAAATTIVWQPETFHMLGLTWQASSDSFLFQLKETEPVNHLTKRNVLSRIAQLFDPLGWLSPVTILAKIFMQSLWLLKLDWDDTLPDEQSRHWNRIYSALPSISKFRIPRWLGMNASTQQLELHGFADASERAYAAVLYLRTTHEKTTAVTLVTAKTKVAPVKQISLPRLELCAAHLVTRLAKTIRDTLGLDCPTHLWSDSTVTLAWIRDHPTRWKTYVANRVADIQLTLPNAIWHHVDSKSNPADCASRGILASELENHALWWQGPAWLRENPLSWPSLPQEPLRDLREERLTSHIAPIETDEPIDLLKKYSSLTKLVRITAWCCRVLRAKDGEPERPQTLSPYEIATALQRLIRAEQRRNFKHEIRTLEANSTISKGTLISLNPLLDDEGFLRVGGRLRNANLDADEKHPYILSRESPLTTLLIEDAHRRTLHGGVQLTLSTLRQQYWLVGGRAAVKAVIHRCLTCARFRATNATQLMGNLPKTRVTESRPFFHSGVDYAGPIYLRTTKGRGHKSYKAYIAVFVCFATRAVHLEAVSDYTTDGFLSAFRRFVSRRGKCATLTSDCGTNFVGADAELRALFTSTSEESEKISRLLANDGTTWKFNPPAAPHFGGLWEAAVRSVKHHLRRVIGENTLTFEEMSTLLSQIEACLNSRPIQPLSDDPNDLNALTPAHFLIGESFTAVPEPSLVNLPTSRLSRWQLIQQMQRHFWDRWSAEYLHHLQARPKWQRLQDPLRVGDLVLIKNETLPPTKWPLARITMVHPGSDGNIRVATVKTATSTFTRPVVKLCPLLKNEEPQ